MKIVYNIAFTVFNLLSVWLVLEIIFVQMFIKTFAQEGETQGFDLVIQCSK